MNHFAPRVVYINKLSNMSVDCNCAVKETERLKTRDIGILASNYILAVNQASMNTVYDLTENKVHDLKERIESHKGLLQKEITTR